MVYGSSSSPTEDHAGDIDDIFASLSDRRIDILKIDRAGSEAALLNDTRFGALRVGVIVMKWHKRDPADRDGREWCIDRLEAFGFRTYVTSDEGQSGIVWAYRNSAAGLATG